MPGRRGAAVLAAAILVLLADALPAAAAEAVRLGVRRDAPPMSYYDPESDRYRGYTIDICREVLKVYHRALGLEEAPPPVYVQVTAGDRLKKLQDGEIDVLCGATTVTVARLPQADFSFFTFLSGAGVMVRQQAESNLQMQQQTAKKQAPRVGVVANTTTEERVEELFRSAATVVPVTSHDDAFQKLQAGEIDYYLGDRVILQATLERSDYADAFVVGPGFLSYEPYAIPVAAGKRALLVAANTAIAELYRSGRIEQIYRAHFGDRPKGDALAYLYRAFAVPEN